MFLHIFVYLIFVILVFVGNVFIDTYTAFVIDIMFTVLSVILFIITIILRCGVDAEFTEENAVAYRNEKCVIGVSITNKSPIPLTFCRVRFRVRGINKSQKERRKSVKRKIVAMCPPRGSVIREVRLNCPHCQVISVEMTKIYVFDFLRIFRIRKKLNHTASIVVLPKITQQEDIEKISAVMGEGEDTLYSTVKAGNDPTEIFSIREYVGGDKIRNIHWKLSSKKSELMVKDYGLPLANNDTIVIDIFGGKLKRKTKLALMDSLFDMLYGLVCAMTRRGFGFNVCYMKDRFIAKRIETQNDINNMFADIYSIKPYTDENSCAVNYYAQRGSEKTRIFYAAPFYNENAVRNMSILSENGTVYYLIPRKNNVSNVPVKFQMSRGDVYGTGTK